MSKPYGLVADIHAHAWSMYSSTNAEGVNSRLAIIMDELDRAADALIAAGGKTLVIAGDLFHERGKIDPETFNYVHRRISAICQRRVEIIASPGNHDLKGRETTELGNSFRSLAAIDDFYVEDRPAGYELSGQRVLIVPWYSTAQGLFEAIGAKVTAARAGGDTFENTDLIIHAGINGVLMNMPDHSIDYTMLEGLGFRRVFAGHYHNHKVFPGGKVVSIGATTHQTWSDIGTKAGFLLVYPDRVQFSGSHAPSFVEVTGETDPDEVPLIVDGNYVRVTSMKLTDAAANKMRDELIGMGAKGVTLQVTKDIVSARTGAVLKSKSLGEAVGDYVGTLALPPSNNVLATCQDILSKAMETTS